ncbi:MAG: O-antigen ligase family protein [Gammaproteobacteria bacterium]|nr:O-antigen ligase family protein [Gammaproteobacteria bacterium]
MQLDFPITKEKALPLAGTILFVLFVVMLPRYTDTAKTWFVLLILLALVYLLFNFKQLQQTSLVERLFFGAVVVNFLWIAFSYYANGEPGRGASFLWGRHFYFLFVIPLFFLFRKIEISDRIVLISLFISITISLGDILIDIAQGINYQIQGMNQNAFGPIQLCLSGMLLFYFIEKPEKSLRWVSLAGSILGLATVIFSESKSTWITLGVLSVVFVFYLARSLPLWKRVSLVFGLIILLFASYLLPLVENRIDHGVANATNYFMNDDYRHESRVGSFGTRMELWKTGWKIFLENPVLGVGVGGFKPMAKANSERYQVNEVVHRYKYVHNQYLAALATRGFPGLILFLLVMLVPMYIAMSAKSRARDSQVAHLSILLICLTYLIGCLAEDHFEAKSAIMFTSVLLPLMLARISTSRPRPMRESAT